MAATKLAPNSGHKLPVCARTVRRSLNALSVRSFPSTTKFCRRRTLDWTTTSARRPTVDSRLLLLRLEPVRVVIREAVSVSAVRVGVALVAAAALGTAVTVAVTLAVTAGGGARRRRRGCFPLLPFFWGRNLLRWLGHVIGTAAPVDRTDFCGRKIRRRQICPFCLLGAREREQKAKPFSGPRTLARDVI